MKNEVLNLTYASSLTDLCNKNSSFDSGILRIAYAGTNRNGSAISKQAFEKSLPTIYNCPVVCHYDRESDSLGGHDMELVKKNDGSYKLVNLTQPVGVIPQGAKVFWDTITEEDGTEREYLCAEALIWKRQEAYQKIKNDGITAQSMEITIKDGKQVNGVYNIYDFEFTAFALIGVRPCFESASLKFEEADKDYFKQQYSDMMHELKESFSTVVNPSSPEGDDKQKYSMEGGNNKLDKNELIKKYGIDVASLDFNIEDFSYDELEEKFKAIQDTKATPEPEKNFELTDNMLEQIHASLSTEKVQSEWGEHSRYCYVDCDMSIGEVYCYDTNDWKLYGFKYSMNGDNVVIDFESKKRKKFAITDFNEGDADESPVGEVFSIIEQKFSEVSAAKADVDQKFADMSAEFETTKAEVEELRKFKKDTEQAEVKAERDAEFAELFSHFEDLNGVEAFEAIKAECAEDCEKYELDALEEKCFAIRGRQGMTANFSAKPQGSKMIIPKNEPKPNKNDLPYGGIFEKYGISINE